MFSALHTVFSLVNASQEHCINMYVSTNWKTLSAYLFVSQWRWHLIGSHCEHCIGALGNCVASIVGYVVVLCNCEMAVQTWVEIICMYILSISCSECQYK